MSRETTAELPDLFRFEDGERVCTPEDWQRRRRQWRDVILDVEYGRLPPTPPVTRGEALHRHQVRSWGDVQHTQYRIITEDERSFQFRLDVFVPAGDGPFPVVLNGDGCWCELTDEIARDVLGRQAVLAQFSRVEIVPDMGNADRVAGLYNVYLEGDYGAIAAWAWGYHRCIDFLTTLDCVDPDKIAVVGHSRGGKTSLLAGATDERIALTGANDSGCGGAGCFRWQGAGSETIADIVRAFPHWFSPRFAEFIDREDELPFDQHCLKALVAPRALFTAEALGDIWANPTGTWQTHLAAREAYRFLGAEDRIGIWYREGGHAHGRADWAAFLDFMDWQFHGKQPPTQFNANPFPELPPAFSWAAP